MRCPKCNQDDPQNREMCPDCGYPVKPVFGKMKIQQMVTKNTAPSKR